MRFRARWVGLLASGLITLCASFCAYSDSVEPYEEISQHLRAAQQIAPLTDDAFGDQINPYDGSTSFEATDISIPGNNALPVALSRHFSIENRPWNQGYLFGFGEWDVEVPYIEAAVTSEKGWALKGSTPQNRCSDTTDILDTIVSETTPAAATLSVVYDGTKMHIPGEGDQELLVNTQSKSPAYASHSTYKWVTLNNWRVSCLSSVSNLSGEGFVAVSPSGVSYTFNWAVEESMLDIRDAGKTIPRSRIMLLATQVKDRFGNTVTYTYDSAHPDHLTSITSSDGRSISLTWTGDNITSASAPVLGTWNYGYVTYNDGFGHNYSSLASVTRPDGSTWTYTNTPGTHLATYPSGECGPFCPGDGQKPPIIHCQSDYGFTPYAKLGEFEYSVTAPSGATATYDFEYDRHYRSGVPESCNDDVTDHQYPYDYAFFDNFSILTKQISGPGLPSNMTWTYDSGGVYADDSGKAPGYFEAVVPYDPNTEVYIPFGGSCSNSGGGAYNVTVTGPTTVTLYNYGNNYGCDQGRLYGTEVAVRNADGSPGTILKTSYNNYIPDSNVPGEPFPTIAGSTKLTNDAHPSGNRVRPVSQTVITQDSATFTTTVNGYDAFARATSESETGSNSKTTTTAYYDDLTKWVLGQVSSSSTLGTAVSCPTNPVTYTYLTSCTLYAASTDLPLSSYAFGKLVSTKVWNTDGTLHSVTDGNNNTTTLSNWSRGIPQSVGYADGTSQSAVVNAAGWITAVTDENGYTTGYAYDAMGRVSQITYPTSDDVAWNATTLSFAPYTAGSEYNIPAGHWKQTITTGTGTTVTYFDALWRPLVTESYDSASKSTTLSQSVKRYDAGGRAIFASYPINTLTDYSSSTLKGTHTSYDALNRVTQVQIDSELGPLTTTTAYLTGFQTQVTDPRGYVTTTSYYTWGAPDTSFPHQITAPEGETTTLTRDVFGKPVYLARGSTNLQALVYDANQQLCKRMEDGEVTGYGYDGAGNMIWSAAGMVNYPTGSCDINTTNAGNQLVTRTYDARNRLSSLHFHDGDGDQSWSYTPDGLPETITTDNANTPVVTNTYLYDKRRLMSGEGLAVSGQFSWAVGYGYDANGHLSTRFTPSGQTYAYQPDALGRPTQLGIPHVNTYVASVSYFPDSHISQFQWNSGLIHQVTENLRGLPTEIHDDMTGDDAEDMAYVYDADGDPTQISDLATGARNETLAYDGLDRLISAENALQNTTTYSYNTLDQLTGTAQGTHTQTLTYGSYYLDQLAKVVDSVTGETDYGYDLQGNLASKNAMNYSFDYGNRLRNVIGYEGSYAYDANGRRVQQTNSGGVINSFYDHTGQLIYQQTRDSKTHDYLYLQGRLVAIRDYDVNGVATAMRYQHTDALGSIIRQTDSSGIEIPGSGAVYDPWGNLTASSAQDAPGYTGQVMDASTNLIYMQQRYYDPTVGRFLSMDPVDASSTNGSNLDRYWYANDNPYRFTDPNGMASSCSTGTHLSGQSCESLGVSVTQVGTPSVTAVRAFNVGHKAYIQYADGATEVRSGSRPFRDNNPGDLRQGRKPNAASNRLALGWDYSPTSANDRYTAKSPFGIFSSAEVGDRALEETLKSVYGNDTIATAIKSYAPSLDSNNPQRYAAFIMGRTGAPAGATINSLTPAQLSGTVDAIKAKEGFNNGGTVEIYNFGPGPFSQ